MSKALAHKTRREFLSGLRQSEDDIRPVGAIDPLAFHDTCTQCGDCARSCPEKIIRRGDDGFPTIDFSRGACTFCGKCTESCEAGALNAEIAWPYSADVSQDCLSLNAVQCRVCQDQCDEQAIRFRLLPGGCATPLISDDDCTGCGACIAACPVGAITLEKHIQPTEVPA